MLVRCRYVLVQLNRISSRIWLSVSSIQVQSFAARLNLVANCRIVSPGICINLQFGCFTNFSVVILFLIVIVNFVAQTLQETLIINSILKLYDSEFKMVFQPTFTARFAFRWTSWVSTKMSESTAFITVLFTAVPRCADGLFSVT